MMKADRLALIYCRVSSRTQTDKWSLPAQERILREHAERQGWAYEIHTETGSGGSIEERPVFRAILARVASGEAHTLLVIDLDRLTRPTDLRDLALLHEVARAGKCRVATPQQSLDLGESGDRMLSTIFGAVAARAKEEIRKTCARGMAEAKAAGRWHGGGVPTGYVYDRDLKTIVPDPERVDEVRLLLEGALTRGARSLREQFPSWSPTAIQRALSRQRVWWYAAKVELDDGTLIQGAWEPIITEDQARAVHAARGRKKLVRHGTKTGRKRILTGLGIFVCGHCGVSIKSLNNSSTWRGVRREYLYYRCNPWWVKGAASDCPNRRGIPCKDLDAAVLAVVWEEMPGLVAAAEATEASGAPALPSPAAAELDAAKARRERLVAAVEDGTLMPGEARDRLLETRKQIAQLTAELEASRPAPLVVTAELRKMIARPLTRVSVEAARNLLALVVERIELHDRDELRIRFRGGREVVRRWSP